MRPPEGVVALKIFRFTGQVDNVCGQVQTGLSEQVVAANANNSIKPFAGDFSPLNVNVESKRLMIGIEADFNNTIDLHLKNL